MHSIIVVSLSTLELAIKQKSLAYNSLVGVNGTFQVFVAKNLLINTISVRICPYVVSFSFVSLSLWGFKFLNIFHFNWDNVSAIFKQNRIRLPSSKLC